MGGVDFPRLFRRIRGGVSWSGACRSLVSEYLLVVRTGLKLLLILRFRIFVTWFDIYCCWSLCFAPLPNFLNDLLFRLSGRRRMLLLTHGDLPSCVRGSFQVPVLYRFDGMKMEIGLWKTVETVLQTIVIFFPFRTLASMSYAQFGYAAFTPSTQVS